MAQEKPTTRAPRQFWQFAGVTIEKRDKPPLPVFIPSPEERKWTDRGLDVPPASLGGPRVKRVAFGPSEDRGAALVARMHLERGTNNVELQIQPNAEGDRAEWIAIRSPDGLRPIDVQRLPWVNLFAVADALNRAGPGEVGEREVSPAERHLAATVGAARRRRRPPQPPKIAKRPGRVGHPDEHYRDVAERYKQLRMAGVTNPTATIADQWPASRSTVAGWIRGARDRGYLPPARPGRAG
ncbi:MAG: hypothetical protein ACYCU7_16220 [Acidimicrobiales bacterium]